MMRALFYRGRLARPFDERPRLTVDAIAARVRLEALGAVFLRVDPDVYSFDGGVRRALLDLFVSPEQVALVQLGGDVGMTTHDVKIEPRWYDRIQENEKFAEVRYDDRDYQTGDTIRFWRDDAPMANRYCVDRRITHVLRGYEGIDDGFVVLSLADPRVVDLRRRLDSQLEECARLARSNRGLRGAITRLKAGR